MTRKITCIFFLLVSTNLFTQTLIVPEGSNWNYLDDGSNQGTAWYNVNFDDSTWNLNSPTPMGYGESVATTIEYGPDKSNKHVTTYFRKTFDVVDPSVFESVILEAIRDDGMVVYLNGDKVWSDNMPDTFDWLSYASSGIGGSNEGLWITKNITNSLVVGTNVIAVEIHQATTSSSDLNFDFKIIGYNEYLISQGSTWNYLDDGSNQGTDWYGVGFDDSSWNLNFPAKFGYGDASVTEINYGPSSSNRYITTYFRKTFNVIDASLYNYLFLEAIRDDGMVVYLNGVKIWSDNMPDVFDSSTYASSGIGGDRETTWISKDIASNLITGTNVIAVEIHQATASSSDLGFDFRLKGYELLPTEVIRGPYLQKGTSTSVVVKWRTNNETESVVKYGTSLGALHSIVENPSVTKEHEVHITGLDPNKKYFYEIADSENVYVEEHSEMFFKTSPEIGTKQFVRAWILGDPGTANQKQKDVRDQYYNYVNTATTNPNQTDMMLFLGDNAYKDGTDEEYQKAMFEIYPDMLKKSVAWSTLGNHDGGSASSKTQSGVYYDIFTFPTQGEAGGVSSNTEAYYSFDYANIHFIVLESHELYADSTQMSWCLSDIQSTTQDWIVVLFHHPIYSKGSHDSDNATSEYRSFEMRKNFQPILEQNGVDLILNGHSHAYERSYFVNGHYGTSDTFDAAIHTVGENGDLSGKADTTDGAYVKSATDTEGAVYITSGSAGHNTGGELNHKAMYSSLDEMGSCILETSTDDDFKQTLTVKFLNKEGLINDYFTINKITETLSITNNDLIDNSIKVYPVPAKSMLNIELDTNKKLKNAKIYNLTGALVKESNQMQINVENLIPGAYLVEVTTFNNDKTYHKIVISN